MRGKLCRHGQTRRHDGITPAGAGKTRYYSLLRLFSWDHPRRCGENDYVHSNVLLCVGSPPQVRGKRCKSSRIRRLKRDHPRRCGENHTCYSSAIISPGSPPQVRGKPEMDNTTHIAIRITPAGAGKTAPRGAGGRSPKDHPRRCGENRYSVSCGFLEVGSPPQVRGKLSAGADHAAAAGITPAGAGKTGLYLHRRIWTRDHPRRCGENSINLASISGGKGSPPQVRGKLSRNSSNIALNGITPAGAGKTKHILRKIPPIYGSPPQVRGKRTVWFTHMGRR